jgi:alkylation response protein AidB-like acyl-CoA dehydrogenase
MMPPMPAPEKLSAAVDEILAHLADHANEAEALRRLPESTIERAQAIGFFESLMPTRWGGAALEFPAFLDLVRRMGAACTSSAWTLSFLALHAWILCKLEREIQEELFAIGRAPRLALPLAPTGKAEKVDGGYRITGRWEWATGVLHADWVMVTCNEPGAVAPRFCVLAPDQVTIEDNWHVAGMAGTGSNAVRVSDAFVPEHRTIEAIRLRFGQSPGELLHGDDPRIAYPLGPTLALVAATPALGAAEGALGWFGARMKEKLQAYSNARHAELPATHLRMGEALADVRAARLVWEHAMRRLTEIGPSGSAAPIEALAEIRLACAHVVRLANQAVNTRAAAAGASAGYLSSPLQRQLRDVQMIRGHVIYDWDRAAQIAGKLALGLPPSPADML